MHAIQKYPRTQHLEGSRLQPGDEDLDCVPFRQIQGRYLVVEEKCDGANAGLRFDAEGRLWLQSRGHYLMGGPRKKQLHLFKQWVHTHAAALFSRLGSRYLVFGEWLYAKHTIFYDQLPHYFLEFDVVDTESGDFLSTQRRRELFDGTPLVPVPVLWAGVGESLDELRQLIGPSLYKSESWREVLQEAATLAGLDPQRVFRETDSSDLMEGLYVKVEEEGRVVERYKLVRASFLSSVLDSGSHWMKRPILSNRLRADVDLFADQP